MVKKLSQKQYLENKGILCPICKSSNTEGGERNFQDELQMTQEIKCLQCGSTWTDLYILKKYFNLKIKI